MPLKCVSKANMPTAGNMLSCPDVHPRPSAGARLWDLLLLAGGELPATRGLAVALGLPTMAGLQTVEELQATEELKESATSLQATELQGTEELQALEELGASMELRSGWLFRTMLGKK